MVTREGKPVIENLIGTISSTRVGLLLGLGVGLLLGLGVGLRVGGRDGILVGLFVLSEHSIPISV